jgi:hypothetical protein
MSRLKFKEVISSSNFKTSIITLFSLALSYNGIETENAQVYLDIFSKSGTELLIGVFTLGFSIATKLIAKITSRTFSWDFLRSSNFLVQATSIIILIAGAFLGQSVVSILATVLIQVVNIITHSAAPVKAEVSEVLELVSDVRDKV